MKIVKLIGVFLAVIVVILAITFGGTLIDGAMPTIATTSYNDAGDRLSKRISEEWKNCKSWNISLYNDFSQEIEQSKASGLITPPHASSLLEQNGLDAADRLCELTFAELKKTNCSYDVIKTNINTHIPTLISKDSSIEMLSDIQQLKKCWTVYYNISVFGWYDYSEGVVFNSTDLTWSKFSGLYNGQNPQTIASSFLQDDIYKKYLSNIASLKSALSSENIKTKLYNNCYDYYSKVTSHLNSFTKGAPLDDNTLYRLTRAYSNLYENYIENDSKYNQLYSNASAAKRNYESELKAKKELADKITSEKKMLANKKQEVDNCRAEIATLNNKLATQRNNYTAEKQKRKKEDIQKSIDYYEVTVNTSTKKLDRLVAEYNKIYGDINTDQTKYNNLR